jgi:hypothetical protein
MRIKLVATRFDFKKGVALSFPASRTSVRKEFYNPMFWKSLEDTLILHCQDPHSNFPAPA